MSSYGSSDEESLVDNIKNKTTGVQLGYVDVPISADEQPYVEDSFIGGEPLWLNGAYPSRELLTCKNCDSLLSLLLQCYAPLPGSVDDRVIYVLGCSKYQCNRKKGSIRCIKGIKKNKEAPIEISLEEKLKLENEKNYEIKLKNGLFGKGTSDEQKSEIKSNPFASGGSSNPFSGKAPVSTGTNPFSSSSGLTNPFAAATKKDSTVTKDTKTKASQPKPKVEEKTSYSQIASKNAPAEKSKDVNEEKIELPQYPGYILYVEKEKIGSDDDVLPPIPQDLQIEQDDVGDAGSIKQAIEESRSKKSGVEEFKSEVLKDAEFQNFSKRVAHNPAQVLRYDLGGKPLIYSSKDAKLRDIATIPKPLYNSNSQRQFELQVMPKAIIDLESNINNVMEGMEWGTIHVYTDVEDFIAPQLFQEDKQVGYVEEWVEVEWEEQIDYTSIKKR